MLTNHSLLTGIPAKMFSPRALGELSYVLPREDFGQMIFQKKISPGFHIFFE